MMARAVVRWRGWAVWAVAAIAVPVAAALLVVATDLLRAPHELTRDDTRFETAPLRQRGLWEVGSLPGPTTERLLGLEDDISHRRLLGQYLTVEPGVVDYEGTPALEAIRAKAQYEITRLSQEEPDPQRRSRLLTMYGVITLDTRQVDEETRDDQVRRAVSAFRNAIELDPENADAKTNLEGVLSREGGVVLNPSNDPTRDRAGGRRSGRGGTGSGY
jgi:hypothetical protein